MLGSIESSNISLLQRTCAFNAFQNTVKSNSTCISNEKDIEREVVASQDILDNVDIEDIKNCALKVGEQNLTEDDIKYGLVFGRSVIADYSA